MQPSFASTSFLSFVTPYSNKNSSHLISLSIVRCQCRMATQVEIPQTAHKSFFPTPPLLMHTFYKLLLLKICGICLPICNNYYKQRKPTHTHNCNLTVGIPNMLSSDGTFHFVMLLNLMYCKHSEETRGLLHKCCFISRSDLLYFVKAGKEGFRLLTLTVI